MQEEIFDIVDEHDRVIGQKSRADVHRLGLRHRAVHILVYNRLGELFLQKRSMHKDCDPGRWDSSAAGHLNAGEDYDAAALRELEEELQVRPAQALRRLFKLPASAITGWEFCWVYRCESEGPFVLDPIEIEDGRWLQPKQLDNYLKQTPEDFSSTLHLIWQKLKKLK